MKDLSTLSQWLKSYRAEAVLIGISLLILILSFLLFVAPVFNKESSIEISKNPTSETITDDAKKEAVFVDLAGSVMKPDVYELQKGSRLNDLLKKAGGLTDEADFVFFSRNFNKAEMLFDEQKFYIPSTQEVKQGLFEINTISLTEKNSRQESASSDMSDLNSMSLEELDSLPGIGSITAQKIIDNRPYSSVRDILDKKLVSAATFEKISNSVSVN